VFHPNDFVVKAEDHYFTTKFRVGTGNYDGIRDPVSVKIPKGDVLIFKKGPYGFVGNGETGWNAEIN
jgi:hypothetical protein